MNQKLSGYVVKLHTAVFRGDHTADVCKILTGNDMTSVRELVKDSFPEICNSDGDGHHFDWIEIRPIYKKVDDAK